jgi:23S rRNA pseudouridine1911/1915/1917 synthase
MPPVNFVVERRDGGQTLAAVLKRRLGLTWSQAKRLIEKRHVKVNGQVIVEAAQRVKAGKRIEVASGTVDLRSRTPLPPPQPIAPAAPRPARPSQPIVRGKGPLPVEIVYSDAAIVVVNKPAGMTTMRSATEAAEFGPRARKYLPRTLAELLPELLGSRHQPVIPVHRIDRDTSGLVVFARTRSAAEHLTQQFRRHTVDRRYLALTRGIPASGRIESQLVRDRGDGRRGSQAMPAPGTAKRAVTHVRVLEQFATAALVECRLETGRTHQVRIHLGESGTPLCGERVYDRPVNGSPQPDESGAQRPMLHAARLGLEHPMGQGRMVWEVEPPADFQQLLATLRGTARSAGPGEP